MDFSAFFAEAMRKIQNYPNLSLGEQVAFGAIAGGFLLILVSIVLFLIQ